MALVRKDGPTDTAHGADAPGPSGDERRAATRLDKVFPVWLEGERGSGLGIARNISAGGMFIETRDPHPLGSQVRVAFPSRDGEMAAIAEVRYVCHLVGRAPAPAGESAGAASGHRAAVRGMGVRFLYFEAGAERPPPVVH
jgi:hypothetical protein